MAFKTTLTCSRLNKKNCFISQKFTLSFVYILGGRIKYSGVKPTEINLSLQNCPGRIHRRTEKLSNKSYIQRMKQ